MEEGQLVRWLKSEGDSVSSGDVLAEIETDKATMELVARGDGILRKVLLAEGETTAVGEVIAIIGGEDEEIQDLIPSETKPQEESGESKASASEQDEGGKESESEEGSAPGTPEEGKAEGDEAGEAEDAAAKDEDAAAEDGSRREDPGARDGGEGGRVKASPLARKMAADAGVDLSGVSGSGPGGRIVVRDIEAVKAEGTGAQESVSEHPPAEKGKEGRDFEDRPLSQMRKTIARRLVESISPVPHFFLRISVDMTRTLAARKRVNQLLEAEGEKVSVNDFILKATAGALARHPEVNAQWNEDSIRRHFRVHIGVAVAVEDGLITPVVRDANRKGLQEISREVRDLAARGREKKLQPEEYTGSTFSLSNLGMFGIQEFTGVINPPEAGILAVGAVEDTPTVEAGEVVVKPIMQVTMSCDHRVIDGATGARFLQTFKEMLEEPGVALI
jgi:pyruvate dehydrogenase E2 component (dihydrolipoamide acetyltransferase)